MLYDNGDYTYCDEHWVTYRIAKSLSCKSETNTTLYAKYILTFFFLIK